MGLLDKIKGMLGGNEDKVAAGVEKAGDVVDDKTDGKYADQVDQAQTAVNDALTEEGDSAP